LERSDLTAVARTLTGEEPATRGEVAATKAAWPLIVNGLPAKPSAQSRAAVRTAIERAGALTLPGPFESQRAASLTGAASGVTATFRGYAVLAQRSWRLIGGAIEQIEHGSAAAARFARANVALYIESIYDSHFGLGQIGKKLLRGYKNLGGEAAFGPSLTQAEVNALAQTYSEPSDRLYPHAGVKLGS